MGRKKVVDVGWEKKQSRKKRKKIPGGMSERRREIARDYVIFFESHRRGHTPRILREPKSWRRPISSGQQMSRRHIPWDML